MKKLERKEMKNLMGGDAPPEVDATCCTTVSDCPAKEGKKAACNSHYTCATDANKNRCAYSSIVIS